MNKKPAPKNTKPRHGLVFSLIVTACLMSAFLVFGDFAATTSNAERKEISISEFQQKYNDSEINEISINTNKVESTVTETNENGEEVEIIYWATKEPQALASDLKLDGNPDVKTQIVDNTSKDFWGKLVLNLLPILLIIMLILFFMRKAAGGGGGEGGPFAFGKSKAKMYEKEKNKVMFKEVAGAEEAKEDVAEVVDFLKNSKKYEDAGATIPKGILMVGPPGTGKTLLARAIAGEADVPFYSVSGSEFVEMFAGVGASRVRDLFKTAKQNAPAIIFMDEIDAIGKQRGQGGFSGGHDEREQTLNQILTEMDGFETGTNVIVIAATNRPDVLDKALLRPGRFDRHVHIDLPDMEARAKIIEVHSKGKKLGKDTDIKEIASKTVGFSGADLQNVMNEAALFSVKGKRKTISQEDINEAVEKVAIGVARKSRKISDKEKKIVAYHEVGHAISGHFTEECEPVHKISIISRGGALGVTWFLPTEDTYLHSEQKMKDEMVSLHGGRIAERIIFGEATTGASNDLERISAIARAMVMTYGMGGDEIGPVVFKKKSRGFAGGMDGEGGDHSEAMAQKIDQRVKELVLEAEKRCYDILKEHEDMLHQISIDLLEKENILRDEFLAYFGEGAEEEPKKKTTKKKAAPKKKTTTKSSK